VAALYKQHSQAAGWLLSTRGTSSLFAHPARHTSRRGEGFKPSSAFDIRRINKENIKAVQLYLTKYISKNTDEFKCQVLNCSKRISQLYTDFYTNADFLDNAYKLEGDKIYETYSERCTLHFIPLNLQSLKLHHSLDEKKSVNDKNYISTIRISFFIQNR
jgi:hypothetical protein